MTRDLLTPPSRWGALRRAIGVWLVFATALGSPSAWATTYFVNVNTGSNTNNGLSAGTAWKNISHALSQALVPGDKIEIAAGTYDSSAGETFPMQLKSGVEVTGPASDPVNGTAPTAIINGNGANPIFLNHATPLSNTTILRNLKLSNGTANIIEFELFDFSTPFTGTMSPKIEKNEFAGSSRTGRGIFVEGDGDPATFNALIQSNSFHDLFRGVEISDSAYNADALQMSPTISGNKFTNNSIHVEFELSEAYFNLNDDVTWSPTISGNTFTGGTSDGISFSISVSTMENASKFTFSPTVTNNTFSVPGDAIELSFDVSSMTGTSSAQFLPTVTGNSMTGGDDGIQLSVTVSDMTDNTRFKSAGTISGNTFQGSASGIEASISFSSVADTAKAEFTTTISGNSFSNLTADGIDMSFSASSISGSADVNFAPQIINNTTFTNIGGNAIYLSMSFGAYQNAVVRSAPTISGNTISNTGATAIYFSSSVSAYDSVQATVAPTISQNSISGATGSSIEITASMSVYHSGSITFSPIVSNNTISGAGIALNWGFYASSSTSAQIAGRTPVITAGPGASISSTAAVNANKITGLTGPASDRAGVEGFGPAGSDGIGLQYSFSTSLPHMSFDWTLSGNEITLPGEGGVAIRGFGPGQGDQALRTTSRRRSAAGNATDHFNLTVSGNTIQNTRSASNGILLSMFPGTLGPIDQTILIDGNTVTNSAGSGIVLSISGQSSLASNTIDITGNKITGSAGDGLYIFSDDSEVGGNPGNVVLVSCNTITGNSGSGIVQAEVSVPPADFGGGNRGSTGRNNIHSNTTWDFKNLDQPALAEVPPAPVKATNNWWGTTNTAAIDAKIHDDNENALVRAVDFGSPRSATVNCNNVAPVANPDTYPAQEDTLLTVTAPGVLANDTDANLDTLTAVYVAGSGPASGTLNLSANGGFTYNPAPNFSGTVTFQYQASDGLLQSAPATVTINVSAVNDPPQAVNDSASVVAGSAVTTNVVANDTDVDSPSLAVSGFTQGSNGSVSCTSTSCTYTASPAFAGNDSYTYTVSDGAGGSAVGTVNVTVTAAPDLGVVKTGPPSANSGDDVTYTIVVKNAGPGTATGVVLDDPTPAGFVRKSVSGGGCTTFPCPLGNLAPQQSVTVTVTYGTTGPATVTNTASVSSTSADPNSSNNASSATTNVGCRAPNAVITAPDPVTVGESATASVENAAGTTYDWSSSTGIAIDQGANTSTIRFRATSHGRAELRVMISTGPGCSVTGTRSIEVRPACTTATPGLGSPADGAAVDSPVTLSWTAVPNASQYTVHILTEAGAQHSQVTTPAISASVPLPSGRYRWSVSASITGCSDTISATRQFTVNARTDCTARPAPTLVSPAAGVRLSASNITFQWNAVADAIGYRVWVIADGTPAQDVGTTSGATSLTTGVPPGAIDWFVEALFAGCPGSRSVARALTATAPDPCAGNTAPILISPSNGATLGSSVVRLVWSVVSGADGYRVLARGNGGEPAVIAATRTDTTVTVRIEPGQIEWWVEAIFDGCASEASEHRRFDVPPSTDCGTDLPILLAPDAGVTVTRPRVTFRWTPVFNALGYEVWIVPAEGIETLAGFTSATSLGVDVPEGELSWFVRAILDRCPSRDSASRRFTFRATPSCPQKRPTPSSPIDSHTATTQQAIEYAWSAVPGVSRYRVTFGDGTSTEVTTNSTTHAYTSTGTFAWYVESIFDGCDPLRSAERTVIVRPPIPACSTPPVPALVVPGEVSSGSQYTIRWTTAGLGITYELQEWSAADQSDLQSFTLTRDFITLSHPNAGTQPKVYFYRVRAVGTCGSPRASSFSSPVLVTILPLVSQPDGDIDAAVPLEHPRTLRYTIPLAASLAGNTFVATPSQPWITVSPVAGTVPPGGTVLNVAVDTTGLSVGTSVGFVAITLTPPADASRGRARTAGGTVVNSTVSVSVVTPVAVSPQTAPPPDALIIPGVAHGAGLNATFESDVRLSNTSASVMKYQVTFTPTGESGITDGKQTTIEVDPGKTVALDDVLSTFFGSSNAFGTLEIRPLVQQATANLSSLLKQAAPSLSTFASSRTFAASENGTYGQYIPAIPFADFIGKVETSGISSVLSLQQIAQNADYRTNLGLVEGSGKPATVQVSVFGSTGTKLTDFTQNLTGGQHLQLNSFLADKGVQLGDGRVEVKVLSPTGEVTAYASVLDNKTNDPLLVTPVTVSETGSTKWVVPGVADLNTGLARWQTDVRIFNASSKLVNATLTFYSMSGGAPKSVPTTILPNEVKQLDSILANTFGVTNDGGALHVTTLTASNLVVTARTYDQTDRGTFGQFISAVTPAEAHGIADPPMQILQVEQSDRYRSNIGLAEVNGKSAKVEVSVIPSDSRVTAIVSVQLGANQYRQLNSVLESLGLTDATNVRVAVKVVEGEGKIAAFASVVDQVTQDPTYIPGQ